MKKSLIFAVSTISIVAFWYVAAKKIAAPLVLPLPADVWRSVLTFAAEKKFATAFFATALRCFQAFFLVAVVGFVLGLIFAFSPFFLAIAEPVLSLIRATPVVSVILLALFWLRSDRIPVLVAFLMALPVMTEAVRNGFSRKNKDGRLLSEMAETFSLSPFQRLAFLHIPFAFPSVSAGLRGSAGMIWKLVCAGEVLSLPKYAVGTFLQNAQVVLETADVFALTAIIVCASFVFCASVNLVLCLPGKIGRRFALFYFSHKNATKELPSQKSVPVSVEKLFVKRDAVLYDDFSVDFAEGSLTAVLAASGLGKTTLLNAISSRMRQQGLLASYLFQEPRLLPNLTVMENVALPVCRFLGAKNACQSARKMLDALSLAEKLDAFPDELSGGERQRAAMARAFLFPAPVLLLDEPFQSQDYAGKMRLIRVFQNIHRERNTTAIVVTHDPFEASRLGTRVLFLDGRPVKIALDLENAALAADEAEKIIEAVSKVGTF